MSGSFERIMNWSGKSVGYYSTIAPRGFYRPEGPVLIYSNGLLLWGGAGRGGGCLNHRSDGPSSINIRTNERMYYLQNKLMTREEYAMWYEIAHLKEYVDPSDDEKWFYQEFERVED